MAFMTLCCWRRLLVAAQFSDPTAAGARPGLLAELRLLVALMAINDFIFAISQAAERRKKKKVGWVAGKNR